MTYPIPGRDEEFKGTITALYWQELDRAPDPGGMAAYLQAAQYGATGEDIRDCLHDSEEGRAKRARPVVPPAPHLEVRGNDFVDATGKRISLCGCDGFLDFRMWLNKSEALEGLLQESRRYGFVVRRVFLQGSIAQNTVMDLWPQREDRYYEALASFVAYENAHGIIPLLTVNVDSQDVMPHLPDRLTHWRMVTDALRGRGSYLLSYGNEAFKNGFNGIEATDPGDGVIWSRGSGQMDETILPRGATAAEIHPVRGEDRTQMDAVASPFTMRSRGCGMLWMDEPLGFASEREPGRRSNDPALAWALGRLYATYWALAIFHNSQGQRGQLMESVTATCAEAWVKGLNV